MMNSKDVAVINTKQIEELIDELKFIEAKLLPQLEGDSKLFKSINGVVEHLQKANENLEKRIEDAFENNPHGIDLKYDIRFVRYALLTDFESVKDVLHVARKLDDRDFISWIAKQVDTINPDWVEELNLKEVPFMKETVNRMRSFDEICHQTIQKKKAQKSES